MSACLPLPAGATAPAMERDASALGAAIASRRDLRGVLEHTRRILDADTATLLLLDTDSTVLEAVASCGLDRTERSAIRVPVGQGFAGRIAATRRPAVLDEVNDTTVLNPVLTQHGIRTLLGAPVQLADTLLGVLHVGTIEHRTFSSEDVDLLVSAADALAATLEVRLAREQSAAALVLQRSLLPTTPMSIAGLDLAARYVPAEGDLGGDWYDVFPLPDGRVGVVMGDVVGHGLHAAVVMGRMRSSLRAYALECADPADVLRRLDRTIWHFERGVIASVLYGVTAPPFDRITFSCAGHLPPLLAAPDRRTTQTTLPADLLLGVSRTAPRRSTDVRLPRGASLCLFTDGLVERRASGETGSDDQLSELAGLTRAFSSHDPAELACSRLLQATIGDAHAEDDIALLVLRRPFRVRT